MKIKYVTEVTEDQTFMVIMDDESVAVFDPEGLAFAEEAQEEAGYHTNRGTEFQSAQEAMDRSVLDSIPF